MSIDKNLLDQRFKKFALTVVMFIKTLPRTEENRIYGRQVIRSSSSIGANYAEAIFAQTRQEFIHCLKISRKEANESIYWLSLIKEVNPGCKNKLEEIIDENTQILKILVSSVKTLNAKNGSL